MLEVKQRNVDKPTRSTTPTHQCQTDWKAFSFQDWFRVEANFKYTHWLILWYKFGMRWLNTPGTFDLKRICLSRDVVILANIVEFAHPVNIKLTNEEEKNSIIRTIINNSWNTPGNNRHYVDKRNKASVFSTRRDRAGYIV